VTDDQRVYEVTFSPDGRYLATAGNALALESGLKVWDARTGRRRPGFLQWGGPVLCVAWSPDGRRLACGGLRQEVTVWEAASGEAALTLSGLQEGVTCLAWSPDGRRLAANGPEGAVRVWRLASPGEGLALRGHRGSVTAVAFTPDGKRLFSAGVERRPSHERWLGEVRVWDMATAEGRLALSGAEQEGSIRSLALSPDGTRLATAHGDGTVNVWSVRDLLGRAR
jgi:WD40 repeat protein